MEQNKKSARNKRFVVYGLFIVVASFVGFSGHKNREAEKADLLAKLSESERVAFLKHLDTVTHNSEKSSMRDLERQYNKWVKSR